MSEHCGLKKKRGTAGQLTAKRSSEVRRVPKSVNCHNCTIYWGYRFWHDAGIFFQKSGGRQQYRVNSNNNSKLPVPGRFGTEVGQGSIENGKLRIRAKNYNSQLSILN